MPKSSKPLPSKETKPRGRNGGRKPTVSEDDRKEQANVWLPRWVNKAIQQLVPVASDRNKLFASWARAYVVANGETDRLLAQSPLAARLLNYLEAQEGEEAEELAEDLQLLIVDRDLEELRAEGAIEELPGGSYLI